METFYLNLAPTLFSILAGLLGLYIGASLTSKREKIQRQLNFVESQLSLFYSPLLGIKNVIHRNSELRETLQELAREEWSCINEQSEKKSLEEKQRITSEIWPVYSSLIDYDDLKFEAELFPLYQEMLEIFRKYYWLADEDTRAYYPTLLQYVEVWNRILKRALPYEVYKRLDPKEKHLSDFYEHLEKKNEGLRKNLKSGYPNKYLNLR